MTLSTVALVGLAFGFDLLLGEPPNRFHPVAWFGRLVGSVDREWIHEGAAHPMLADDRSQRAVGVIVAATFPLVPAAVAWWLVVGASTVHSMLGLVAAAVVLSLSVSVRMLLDLTREILAASVSDVERARESIIGLVGRDVAELSGGELRSAAVESVAENFADGVVATVLPFALLAPISLPAAAAAAAWVKGVNTLDSMLGYPSKPIGTASARLDDAVMYLPARISAVLLAIAAIDPLSLYRARQWARVPSSPNSGWPMATLACALDVRLEKQGAYVINPNARLPTVGNGERAITIVAVASALTVVLAAVCALVSPSIAAVLSSLFETALERLTSLPNLTERLLEWLTDVFRRPILEVTG